MVSKGSVLDTFHILFLLLTTLQRGSCYLLLQVRKVRLSEAKELAHNRKGPVVGF